MTSPIPHEVDVLVVGGGPAGIAAARRLRGHRVLLLERSDRLGGRLKSLPRGEYWMNLGGHLFPGAGSHVQTMLDELGLRTIEIPGHKFAMTFAGKLRRNKRVESYPFTLPMTLAERFAMVRTGLVMLKAVRGWHQAMAPRASESEQTRRNRVAAYLGDRTFRDLIGHPPERVDAIYRSAARRAASEIDEQAAGVGVSLFGAVWSGAKSSMALNLAGGSGRLGEAALEDLGEHVALGTTVTKVVPDETGVSVSYTRAGVSGQLRAQHVIMAIPAPAAVGVVEGLPADVAKTLGEVTFGPFLTMGIITDENGAMPYDDVYAITTPAESFDMCFNHANPVRRPGRRAVGGSLMVYSGGAPAAALMEKTDEEVRDTYLADLLNLFPQLRGHIKETVVQRWELGNIYRTPGFDFAPMLAYSDRDDVRVRFCGDWFAELGNMEIAAGSALEAADRIAEQLARSVAA